MLSETTLASNDDFDQWFQVVRIHADPENMSPVPVIDGLYETDAYAQALQALRDVRHLLPLEGVAIVDAVLDLTA